MDHQQEMAYGKSDGHVLDDVTRPIACGLVVLSMPRGGCGLWLLCLTVIITIIIVSHTDNGRRLIWPQCTAS